MTPCRATPGGYVIDGQHADGCADPACRACRPCEPRNPQGGPQVHCTARSRCTGHLEPLRATCARCLGLTRRALTDVEALHARMLGEAIAQGVNSEAANLAGPADPEGWQARREDADRHGYTETLAKNDPAHPLNVLGRWDLFLRNKYNQPTRLRLTVPRATAYLKTQLNRFSEDPDANFPQFVREVFACRAHAETVIRDHGTGDRANIGCFDCGGSLERKLTASGFEDAWTCRECARRYTYAEYNLALRAALEVKLNATV